MKKYELLIQECIDYEITQKIKYSFDTEEELNEQFAFEIEVNKEYYNHSLSTKNYIILYNDVDRDYIDFEIKEINV